MIFCRVSQQAPIQTVTFDLRREPSKSLKEEYSRECGQQEQRPKGRSGLIFSRKNREVSMQQRTDGGQAGDRG